MPRFAMEAIIERTVRDHVTMIVEAENILVAYTVAENVAESFPDPHDESGVPFCYINSRENGVPILVDLYEREDTPSE